LSAETLSPDLEYYIGKLQPQYEFAGQAKIAEMLGQYGIPFFYKQPALIFQNGRRNVLRPDFTLPTYNNAVIEYHPDNDRAAGASSKSDAYRANNIAALFLGQSDLTGPHWQQRLYDRLEEIYDKPLAYRNDRQH